MSDLETLLREAAAQRVTMINIDSSARGIRVGAWKAHTNYSTAYGTDVVDVLTEAVNMAMGVKKTSDFDLTDLLGK